MFLIREAIRAADISSDLHVVEDGHQAIQFLDSVDAGENARCPDLVLLDLNLPKRNGEEVLRHLRNSRMCKDWRVVIVSSAASPRNPETLDAAQAYFRKPLDFDEFLKLGSVIKNVLEQA